MGLVDVGIDRDGEPSIFVYVKTTGDSLYLTEAEARDLRDKLTDALFAELRRKKAEALQTKREALRKQLEAIEAQARGLEGKA